jgi:hypothetical protein
MEGVNGSDAVEVWRGRVEALVSKIGHRSRDAIVIAREIGDRLVTQEKDIEALLYLLAREREKAEAADGRETVRGSGDDEIARLREYALSVRLREVAAEKALNGERQKVAALEAEFIRLQSRSS